MEIEKPETASPLGPFSITMDSAPIFSAEQIKVAEDLPAILKEYTKAVIRANPEDVVQFSAE